MSIQFFDKSPEELQSFNVFEDLIARAKIDIQNIMDNLLYDHSWARTLISAGFTELKSVYWDSERAVEVFAQYINGIENVDSIDAIIDFISKSTNDGKVKITKPNNWQINIDVIPGPVEVWWNRDNRQNLPIDPLGITLDAQVFVQDNSNDGNPGIVFEKAGFGMTEKDLENLLNLITSPGLYYKVNFII